MRARTTDERNRMSATAVNHYIRVEVTNGSGVWKDLTALGGYDWVDGWSITASIDQPVASGTVSLKRETSAVNSLAPLMQNSALNVLAGGGYAPLLDVGRKIRISTAVTAANTAPITADWKLLLDGKIDEIDWEADPITVQFRDMGALLLDTFIETKRAYGSAGGTAVQTEMQKILDDNLGVNAVILYTPVSPGWLIHQYEQDTVSVMDALRALALQIGWDVRYKWDDGTSAWRLTLYDPGRARTVSDDSFGPTEYRDVTQLRLSDADVRNVVRVAFYDSAAGGVLSFVTRTNSTSITRYGRRFMQIALSASSNVDTVAEATAMADAAVADLAFPPGTHEIATLFYWPIELTDLHTYVANGVHYDVDQQFAVTGYRHDAKGGEITTAPITRGSIAGAYKSWLATEGPALSLVPVPDFAPGNADGNSLAQIREGTETRVIPVVLAKFRAPLAPNFGNIEYEVTPAGGVTKTIVGGSGGATAAVYPGDRIAVAWGVTYSIRPVTVTLDGVRNTSSASYTVVVEPDPSAALTFPSIVATDAEVIYTVDLGEFTAYFEFYMEETETAQLVPPASAFNNTAHPFRVVYRNDPKQVSAGPLGKPRATFRASFYKGFAPYQLGTFVAYDRSGLPTNVYDFSTRAATVAPAGPAGAPTLGTPTWGASSVVVPVTPYDAATSVVRITVNGAVYGADVTIAANPATTNMTIGGLVPGSFYTIKFQHVLNGIVGPQSVITGSAASAALAAPSLRSVIANAHGFTVSVKQGTGNPTNIPITLESSLNGTTGWAVASTINDNPQQGGTVEFDVCVTATLGTTVTRYYRAITSCVGCGFATPSAYSNSISGVSTITEPC